MESFSVFKVPVPGIHPLRECGHELWGFQGAAQRSRSGFFFVAQGIDRDQAHLPIAQRAQQRKNLIDAAPMGARGDGLAVRGDRRIFARLIYAPKLIATCAYSTWATARFGL